MYTIKQAAQRSGVSVPLLRAWERRYGVVQPARTASRYRLYDDRAIARLIAMRALIEDGWAPSTAASRVLEASDEVVLELAAPLSTAIGAAQSPRAAVAPDIGSTGTSAVEALKSALVESAAAFDESAFEAVLDEMFARGSFEHVTTDMVMPSLVMIGERWASGRLDVAAEHAVASAVQRRLGSAFLAAGRASGERGAILVGLPPGARHELGALAFATAARRAGLAVRYLGADLPVENWVDVAVRTQAAAAVIGVVIESDTDAAERVARALRATRPDMVVAVGGPASSHISTGGDTGLTSLPPPLLDAVDALEAALAGRRDPSGAPDARP